MLFYDPILTGFTISSPRNRDYFNPHINSTPALTQPEKVPENSSALRSYHSTQNYINSLYLWRQAAVPKELVPGYRLIFDAAKAEKLDLRFWNYANAKDGVFLSPEVLDLPVVKRSLRRCIQDGSVHEGSETVES